MQPLQICIGPTIRIGRESWCLPYAGFLKASFGLFCNTYLLVFGLLLPRTEDTNLKFQLNNFFFIS